MTVADIDNPAGRDLDAAIAEHVLGWVPYKVPVDANGENECEILAPIGWEPGAYEFPPKGRLHRAWLAPGYHRDLAAAPCLSRDHGRDSVKIEANLHEMPTRIARQVLKEAIARKAVAECG